MRIQPAYKILWNRSSQWTLPIIKSLSYHSPRSYWKFHTVFLLAPCYQPIYLQSATDHLDFLQSACNGQSTHLFISGMNCRIMTSTELALASQISVTQKLRAHGAPCYVPIKAEIGWVSVCSPQDKSPSTARRLFRRSSSECEKWRPIITSYGFLWFHIWIYYMDIYIYMDMDMVSKFQGWQAII